MTETDALAVQAGMAALDPRRSSHHIQAEAAVSQALIRLCPAARKLLGWSQQELAARAKTTLLTISRIERGVVDPRASTLRRIKGAFENAGIEFEIDDEFRIGLWLKPGIPK
jgi:ribosome-binding protein aMBF1 (putative translation factor)